MYSIPEGGERCNEDKGYIGDHSHTSEKELLYAPEFSGVHSGKNHCERRKKWSVRICRKTNAVCAGKNGPLPTGDFSLPKVGKNRRKAVKDWIF